jgi:hypothetical protein
MIDAERFARLIDTGQRLAGQVATFAIQGHIRDEHAGVFDDCGNGTCRSSRLHLWKWETAAGDEGHNWIAEMGRCS